MTSTDTSASAWMKPVVLSEGAPRKPARATRSTVEKVPQAREKRLFRRSYRLSVVFELRGGYQGLAQECHLSVPAVGVDLVDHSGHS